VARLSRPQNPDPVRHGSPESRSPASLSREASLRVSCTTSLDMRMSLWKRPSTSSGRTEAMEHLDGQSALPKCDHRSKRRCRKAD
jgi:hypothetical protein